MGLLDWMGDIFGSTSLDGSTNLGTPPTPQPDAPLQPAQTPPQSAYAAMPGGDSGAGPQPPVPLPQPRPPGADAGAQSLPPLPTGNVPDAPTPTDISARSAMPPQAMQPGADPAAALQSYQAAGGNPMMPPPGGGQQQQATGILGRALGLNQQQSHDMRARLGAGLKSVGENYTKPGLAAFSGSAGSAMEGGTKADDKAFEQRQKALTDLIAAKAKGNAAEYMQAQIKYLKVKGEAEQLKAANPGAAKAAMSPEQRLIAVQKMVNGDQQIRAARDLLRTAVLPQDKKDAQAKLDKLVDDKTKAFTADLTPGSQQNPLKPTSMEDAKGYQPGQFFINPADGKLYRYKGTPDKETAKTPDDAEGMAMNAYRINSAGEKEE